MSVKKIWLTENAEDLIVGMARVSNPTFTFSFCSLDESKEKEQKEKVNNQRLLKYLIKNSHWSPFEMVNLCVEINTTRAISAQIIRHRSFSFQEFSQRYASVDVSTSSPFDLRSQDLKNRQNSIDDIPEEKKEVLHKLIKEAEDKVYSVYETLLKEGVAKECARFILPMSSPTKIYMNGSIRSWIHYLKLRSGNGTQKEHLDIANAIIEIFKVDMPNLATILEF